MRIEVQRFIMGYTSILSIGTAPYLKVLTKGYKFLLAAIYSQIYSFIAQLKLNRSNVGVDFFFFFFFALFTQSV